MKNRDAVAGECFCTTLKEALRHKAYGPFIKCHFVSMAYSYGTTDNVKSKIVNHAISLKIKEESNEETNSQDRS